MKSSKKKTAIKLQKVNKTFSVKENRATSIRERFKSTFTKKSSKRQILALQDINLKIKSGEIFGVIGKNGSGKSTLINIMMGSIPPDRGGEVSTRGKMMRLSLGLGVDPNLSARDNIYVNGSIIGLSFKKIGSIFDTIISFAGLDEFVDTPVKYFSKGMKQRLMFSIAMHAEADIFLLDEFFGGTGDEDFKKKSDLAFQDKILQGRTIIIVSHSMAIIQKYCTRVIWLDKGKIIKMGDASEVVKAYKQSFNTKKLA